MQLFPFQSPQSVSKSYSPASFSYPFLLFSLALAPIPVIFRLVSAVSRLCCVSWCLVCPVIVSRCASFTAAPARVSPSRLCRVLYVWRCRLSVLVSSVRAVVEGGGELLFDAGGAIYTRPSNPVEPSIAPSSARAGSLRWRVGQGLGAGALKKECRAWTESGAGVKTRREDSRRQQEIRRTRMVLASRVSSLGSQLTHR